MLKKKRMKKNRERKETGIGLIILKLHTMGFSSFYYCSARGIRHKYRNVKERVPKGTISGIKLFFKEQKKEGFKFFKEIKTYIIIIHIYPMKRFE